MPNRREILKTFAAAPSVIHWHGMIVPDSADGGSAPVPPAEAQAPPEALSYSSAQPSAFQ